MTQDRQERSLRVCIISPDAVSVLQPEARLPVGFGDMEAASLAQAISLLPGVNVTVAGADRGQSAVLRQNGIELCVTRLVSPGPSSSAISRVRWLIERALESNLPGPRVVAAWCSFAWRRVRRIARLRPDVLCLAGLVPWEIAGQAVAYAKLSGVPLLLFAGRSGDFNDIFYCSSTEQDGNNMPGDLGYLILRTARHVIVQSATQAALAQERFGIAAKVIPWFLLEGKHLPEKPPGGRFVLWMGQLGRTFRPEIVAGLASRMPDVSFVMVAHTVDINYRNRILQSLPGNVVVEDYVCWYRLDALAAGAAIVLDTFAEDGLTAGIALAAASGVPVVSLSNDPDGILAAGGGIVAGDDPGKLEDAMRDILSSPARWKECSDIMSERQRQMRASRDILLGELFLPLRHSIPSDR